jgi:hypothetical protein
VIERLLDFYEAHSRNGSEAEQRPAPNVTKDGIELFQPDHPPDLTHTRILAAEFDGRSAVKWNELVKAAHRSGIERLKSFEAVRSSTRSQIRQGRHRDKGFHYVADLDISIQYVQADLAWINILHLARRLKVPVRVSFEWGTKGRKASQGLLAWTPVGKTLHENV